MREIQRAELSGEDVVEVAGHERGRDEIVREVDDGERGEAPQVDECIAQRAQVVVAHVERRRVLELTQVVEWQLGVEVGRQVDLVIFCRLLFIFLKHKILSF